MSDSSSRLFRHKVLVSAVATALLPGVAHASAGRVDFAYGDVKSVKPSGLQQRLRKGSQIEQGDTIVTARGRAQIRFSDGARTSLLPNSEFRVDTYEFEEEKEEEAQGFFSLLKGGLRTITGVIGKLRQSAYQVTTPSATIGIRGTEYLVVLGNSANIWVGDGQIEACNEGGCQTFQGGESGYIADQNTKPIHTDTKPDTSGSDLGNDPFSSAEDVNENGVSDVFSQGFDNGAFYTLAVSVGGDSSEGISQAGVPPNLVDATFNGIDLTSYRVMLHGNVGTASVFESGGDGIIGWGRWADGTIETDVVCCGSLDLSADEGHHYAIGLPTAVMPSGTGSYDLLAGTSPTYADGRTGPGTLDSASLNVDFDTAQVNVTAELFFGLATARTATFNIDTASAPLRIGDSRGAASFGGSGNFTTGSGCSSGPCYTSIEGFFAGAGASRAGVVYQVTDFPSDATVNGAAGFTKSGPGEEIPPPSPDDL